MDTERDAGGAPVQTTFRLPPCFHGLELSLLLERGTHQPSSAECLAPFHQDRTQRIAALPMPHSRSYIVFPVEALLRLADGREGCEIGWDEWKEYMAIPSILKTNLVEVCVSGCRLFCITGGRRMEVYDFSMGGRAKYLSEQTDADLGGVRYLAPTGAVGKFPWELFDVDSGHDGVAFLDVSIPLSCAMRSSDVSHSIVQISDASDEEIVLRVCTF